MQPAKFTAEWYWSADENELLALTHTYDAELSHWLITHPESRDPKTTYIVRDGIVRTAYPYLASVLVRFGYSVLV